MTLHATQEFRKPRSPNPGSAPASEIGLYMYMIYIGLYTYIYIYIYICIVPQKKDLRGEGFVWPLRVARLHAPSV